MSYRKNDNFRRVILIDDTEWELPEDVLSEIPEVDWPTPGSLPDPFLLPAQMYSQSWLRRRGCDLDTTQVKLDTLVPLLDEIEAAYLPSSSVRPFR
jgi:hypothetical protein